MKLDETDFEILAELDLNARSTNAKIGRKLNLSENVVRYRIRNLEGAGVIKGYSAFVDVPRLGYLRYRIYLKLQYVSRNTEKEIMDYLKDSQFTWWCCYLKGRFDVCAIFWFENPEQANDLWDDFRMFYKPYIKEAVVVPFSGETITAHPFTKQICKSEVSNKSDIAGGVADVDQKDRSILRTLSSQGRAPLPSIAKEVGLKPGSVKYRIDRLVNKKVILGFVPRIDLNKLGYTSYKVDFTLNSMEEQKKIQQHLLNNPNLYTVIKTIGWADLETRLYARNLKELYEMLYKVRDEFSDNIRCIDLYTYQEIVKTSHMPGF